LTPPPYQTTKQKQEIPALTANFEAGKKNTLSLLLYNQSSTAKEKLMATRSSAKRVHAHGLDPLAGAHGNALCITSAPNRCPQESSRSGEDEGRELKEYIS
jgi:hypothetical protein